jgi:ferrous iron transport protein B
MEGHSAESLQEPHQSKVVLVGNPNVGKSAIFGALTGKYVVVSNYPGTTVEVSKGHITVKGKKVEIIDTPGANSLVPMSEDERVTRDILLESRSAAFIQVGDAKNLRRALIISTQLAEFDAPFVLDLNMIDEARSRGIRLHLSALSETLGVPVVGTIATQKSGLDRLASQIPLARRSPYRVKFDRKIEDAVQRVVDLLGDIGPGSRGIALTILSGDESISSWLHERLGDDKIAEIDTIREELQSKFHQPLGYVIYLRRLKQVEKLLLSIYNGVKPTHDGIAKRSRLRRLHPLVSIGVFTAACYGIGVLTAIHPAFAILGLPILLYALFALGEWGMHPVLGVPVLAIVLYLTWVFVGNFGAGSGVDFLQDRLFGGYINPLVKSAVSHVPSAFVRDLIAGPYGIVTMALTYALAIVFPVVGTFFLAFGLLEDSGYLPRLAVIVDRAFKKMGMNGKAVLPMVLGLGCDTMATLTARILDTKRERVIVTLLLALGVPCSAQLGVILGILGGPGMPISATLIWAGVVLLVLFKVGYLAGKLIPGDKSDFILEVPPVRMPQLENIVIKTLARVEWYVKEAVPLFIVGTLVLFTTDRLGLLKMIERVAAPVVQVFLGLPAKATEAFLIGFLRRDYGVAGLLDMSKAHQIDTRQMVVALVTITLFIPCLANFLVMIKERGIKTAVGMALFIVPYAFLIGGILNWVLRATGAFK